MAERGSESTVTERDYDLEYHKARLGKLCRLCKKTSERKLMPAKDFKKQINGLHKIDIDKDSELIHPKSICYNCVTRLRKYQKHVNARKEFVTHFAPALFSEHGNNCSLCGIAAMRQTRSSPLKTPARTVGLHQPAVRSHKRKQPDADSKSKSPRPSKARRNLIYGTLEPAEATLQSLPVTLFLEDALADRLKCRLCLGVPLNPAAAQCGHLYCMHCIRQWLSKANACPTCKLIQSIEDIVDLAQPTSTAWSMYSQLHIPCQYKVKGCQVVCSLKDLDSHQNNCKYGKYRALILQEPLTYIKRGPGKNKIPLVAANREYVRAKRLKSLIDNVQEFCTEKCESRLDVLFFLLHNELTELGMQQKAKKVKQLWETEEVKQSMAVDECLAMRVEILQSKGQYRRQYKFFNELNNPILKPPNQLNSAEENYMPGNVQFEILDISLAAPIEKHRAEVVSVPVNVQFDFHPEFPELPIPNCKGVRWSYVEALAKTLEEMHPDIEKGLNALDITDTDHIIKVFVKDGGDGMGEIAIYKEKDDRFLPNQVLRFAFCIFQCRIILGSTEHIIFDETVPNSVRKNRPILEAICDENDKAAATICLAPIEMERSSLKGKILKVRCGNKYIRYELNFISSMEDEKYDRAFGGLQGSGSAFLCTLCHATRETARSEVGNFKIERTLEETSNMANYLQLNPDKLSQAKLNKISLGVKTAPLLMTQPKDRMIDATHADINMASFFKKLLVRLIAGVEQWDCTKDVKKDLESAENKFDIHVKKVIGINPQLMLPGNYARTLFDPKNRAHILYLINNERTRSLMDKILTKFTFMRKVYRALKPEAEDIKQYKTVSINFAQLLENHFKFVKWPNYLHKLMEHVQELLEDKSGPGSIGAVSCEGSEAGNKIFRHFRKNMASRGNTYNGLKDVLRLHWLYSSPELQRIATITYAKYKCSLCNLEGHNRATCPTATLEDNASSSDAESIESEHT